MKDAEVIQVIRTRLLRRGRGQTDDDPVRIIEQFWTLDGELLAENDPSLPHYKPTIVDRALGRS